MKKLVYLFFLTPFFAVAQDCNLKSETDPFTKERKISTGFIFVNGGSLIIDADKKEVVFLFSLNGEGKCFDNNSTASIIFEGIKSKGSARNGGTMNCEGLFQIVYRNSASTTSMLQKLMSQKISSIIFKNSDKKEFTITITPEKQIMISNMATCLVNESKTLL